MIRKTVVTIIVVLAATVIAASAWAEEPATSGGWQKQPAGDGAGAEGRQRRAGRGKFVQTFNQVVQPTDEQKEQLKPIFAEHHKEMRAWHEKNAEALKGAREKLRQAHRDHDKEAAQAALAELKKIHEGAAEITNSLQQQLGQVLTEEQMAKAKTLFQKMREGRQDRRQDQRGGFGNLKMTDEQQAKATAIMDEARKQAEKTDDPEVKRELMQDARTRVMETVLTAEQKQRAQQAMERRQNRRQQRPDLDLTEDQQAKREEIMLAAREKAQEAEGREKGKIMRQAMKQVYDEVLTDEQRQKLRQARREHSPLGRLGATEEQHEQAEAILREAGEKARQAESRKEGRKIMWQARKRIHDEVLTDEQREKIEQMRQKHQGEGRRGKERGKGPHGGPEADAGEADPGETD